MKPVKVSKMTDKILTVMCIIISIVPYIILGAYVVDSAEGFFPEENIGGELLIMGCEIIIALFWLYFNIILHEAGHLILGLATGWRFVSFRIGSLAIVKHDGRIARKKTNVPGTAGQCLMAPPDCVPENCPVFLYLLGGGLINIVLGAIAFLIALPLSGIAEIIFNIGAITGIGLGAMNLFPAKMFGTMNDGYQICIEFPHNPKAKAAIHTLLTANALFTEVQSPEDIPENVRKAIMEFDYSDLSDTSTANLLLYKAELYVESGNYKDAEETCKLLADSEKIVRALRNEACCELAYFEIMGGCDGEKIDRLMDKALMEYIKSTLVMPSRRRLMYAYYLVYKKDSESAEKEYKALITATESHPSRLEAVIEKREAERIRERAETAITMKGTE